MAQRLAWIEGVTTLGTLGVVMLVSLPPAGGSALPAGHLARLGLIAGVCLLSFYFCDLYTFDEAHDFGVLFQRLCRALGWSALLLAGTYLVFPEAIVHHNVASHGLMVLLGVLLIIRGTVYALAKRGPFSERVLIMGAGSLATQLAEQIRARPDLALRVIGFLGDPSRPLPAPRLGGYEDVADVVRRQRPDRLVVALPDRRGRLPVAQLLACRVRGLRIEDGAAVFERLTRRLAVESLTPSALIFGDGFRVTRARLVLKRVLSLGIAVVALVAAAPLMALIAVAIKLDSPGPVFFIQERVGLRGRVFRLIKFRTMWGAPSAAEHVVRDNESRVTRVGATLRRYRLDELPQFINILRGEMSLVGPRPEIPALVATYSAAIPWYHLRHEVRPGLTGWAQVRAGYAMGVEETSLKLCYDLYYIKHMSVLFDLRILFDTVKFVLGGRRPG